jgi:hypothetical protein
MLSEDVDLVYDFLRDEYGDSPFFPAMVRIKTALAELGTSHNSAMDAIACEYLNQLITRYESAPDINDRDFLIKDLLNEWKRKQQHQ